MNKTGLFMVLALAAVALALAGCQRQAVLPGDNAPIYNESLNKDIEGMMQDTTPDFVEFDFQYKQRNESKYEIAETDVFTELGTDLNASEISVFGVMLGDNYSTVLEYLGIPDVMVTPPDKSYRNMEYGKKIGIGGNQTALTIHLDNDTVTGIHMRAPFAKYLQGNASTGTPIETYYELIDLPDYTDFTTALRVIHYVEKGLDLYFDRNKLNIMSLVTPKVFKGVKYVTERVEVSPGTGIFVNKTKAVLVE